MPSNAGDATTLNELVSELRATREEEEDEAVAAVTQSVRRVTLSPSKPLLVPVHRVPSSDSESDTQEPETVAPSGIDIVEPGMCACDYD